MIERAWLTAGPVRSEKPKQQLSDPSKRSVPKVAKVKKKIADEISSPWAQRQPTSFFSGLILYRMSSKGRVEVVAISYESRGEKTFRVPGGSGKPRETPPMALMREWKEELCLTGTLPHMHGAEVVHVFNSRDDSRRGTHTKFFFLVNGEQSVWSPRTFPINDGEATLGVPEYLEITELLLRMRLKPTVWQHYTAVLKALWLLAERSEKVALAYSNYLSAHPKPPL